MAATLSFDRAYDETDATVSDGRDWWSGGGRTGGSWDPPPPPPPRRRPAEMADEPPVAAKRASLPAMAALKASASSASRTCCGASSRTRCTDVASTPSSPAEREKDADSAAEPDGGAADPTAEVDDADRSAAVPSDGDWRCCNLAAGDAWTENGRSGRLSGVSKERGATKGTADDDDGVAARRGGARTGSWRRDDGTSSVLAPGVDNADRIGHADPLGVAAAAAAEEEADDMKALPSG
jgi:hypothetical protein